MGLTSCGEARIEGHAASFNQCDAVEIIGYIGTEPNNRFTNILRII